MQNKKIILSLLGIIGLLSITLGISVAFFNYTRVGNANFIRVGKISFNTSQNNTIELTNVFPVKSINLNSNNSATVTISITGDTTYSEGVEYKVTLEDINNTFNDKEIPISFNVSATNLGDKSDDYYHERGQNTNIYNLVESGVAKDGTPVLIGYIKPGSDGIDGSIDITAYLDIDKIGISDTYSRIENGELIIGETTSEWAAGRVILTTSEWSSFQNTPISFKVKVEANEGIWVNEPQTNVMTRLMYIEAWRNIKNNVTSIEFSTNPIVPDNAITSIDVTDLSSINPVTLYTLDDGLGNNTYKVVICADGDIYAPTDSALMFMSMPNLVTFDTTNFFVDYSTDLQYMFYQCSNLVNIDLSSWNTSNVTNMASMFSDCKKIADFSFLANWDTSNVEWFNQMFYNCLLIENVDFLLKWDTSKAVDMRVMFANCSELKNVDGLINWNVENVTNMQLMFASCLSLVDLKGLSKWNTSKVTNMTAMFSRGSNLGDKEALIVDVSSLANWNVSNITTMQSMFQNVNISSYLPFKNWNVGKVEDFSSIFNTTTYSIVTSLSGLENWNVSSATNMNLMFCENVSLGDASAINNWDINANIDFTRMFYYASAHPTFTKVSGTWDSEGTFTPA